MPIDNVLASLAVRDMDSAIAWYEQLLGRAPDARPLPELAEWKFSHGGWLQIYQSPIRAGEGSCTLAVTGLEEQIARLENLGVDTGERAADEKVHTVMIVDPDGNHIALSEAFDPTLMR